MALNQKAGSPLAIEPHVSGIQHHDIVEICSGVRERLTPYLRNGNARSLSSSIPELVQNFCSGLQVELEAARDDFAEKQREYVNLEWNAPRRRILKLFMLTLPQHIEGLATYGGCQ